MSLVARAAVTATAVVFAVLIPVLEINDTHLFNPGWPEHARLHEAWQLMTNMTLSILACFLIWSGRAPRIAIGISLSIGVSFLLAIVLSGTYGGSMRHMDGSELTVAGVNVAVLIAVVLTTFLLIGWARLNRSQH